MCHLYKLLINYACHLIMTYSVVQTIKIWKDVINDFPLFTFNTKN